MIKLGVFIIFLCFENTFSQVLQFGECRNVGSMVYFDLERFLGQWYEIERFPIWYEENGDCAIKRIQSCGRKIEIESNYVRDGIQYILKMNSTYVPGSDAVFIIEENKIDPIAIPLTVTHTDYSNYAVVYGCKYYETLRVKYIAAWILSRTSILDDEILNRARLELNGLPYSSVAYLKRVKQGPQYCEHHWTVLVQASSEDDNKGNI